MLRSWMESWQRRASPLVRSVESPFAPGVIAFSAAADPSSSPDGVPISLKDQFDIAGTELTQGYVAYLGLVNFLLAIPDR
jgi:hypothetical protein